MSTTVWPRCSGDAERMGLVVAPAAAAVASVAASVVVDSLSNGALAEESSRSVEESKSESQLPAAPLACVLKWIFD